MAARLFASARSRSRWPCQSMPMPPPHSSTIDCTNLTTAAAPAGVAWPTVSAMHTRDAPARIAVEYSARSESGSARVVSSVTYITVSPCLTAKLTASSVSRWSLSSVQSSAYCRIGLDPMNVEASIVRPVRCEISAMGAMSAMHGPARHNRRAPSGAPSTISRASRSTSRDDVRSGAGQADVRGVDAEPIDEVQDPDLLRRCPASAPTATAARRAASRHRASPAARPAVPSTVFQS